jgi:hypothetical protein
VLIATQHTPELLRAGARAQNSLDLTRRSSEPDARLVTCACQRVNGEH